MVTLILQILISYNYNTESCSWFKHILLIREHLKGLGRAKTLFGPLHEGAEYQVIVYSHTKLTLLTVLLALPHHLSH